MAGSPVLGGVLGDVLGDVVLPLLPEPMPLLGVLGVLGDVVPPAAPLLAPEAAPKCASHSAREIWPSLFLSTAEKLGALLLAPADAAPLLGALDEPDAPVELLPDAPAAPLPDALGALSPPDAPVDDEPELCAMATLARANSAAAVAVLISLNIGQPSFEDGM